MFSIAFTTNVFITTVRKEQRELKNHANHTPQANFMQKHFLFDVDILRWSTYFQVAKFMLINGSCNIQFSLYRALHQFCIRKICFMFFYFSTEQLFQLGKSNGIFHREFSELSPHVCETVSLWVFRVEFWTFICAWSGAFAWSGNFWKLLFSIIFLLVDFC